MTRTPAEQVLQAIAALETIDDPQEQALRGHQLQETMKGASMQVRRITDAAVAKLRETKPLAEVADLLGVSNKRISQMATGRHGVNRRPPSTIFAVQIVGEDTWHGEPDALPPTEYQTTTWQPKTGTGNRFDGKLLEVRYGPVPDNIPPSYYTYTTVDGKRMRPTAAVHDVIFSSDE
ncbi:hypothetical protein Amsp01_018040 [Amycolatopsis sp. NBRC 101858]|uniref:hypothetical protein n=1 Tax=Amycolatopsis sp. NBRC 101858 TaxID=3032200 RepID=UPI0024A17253|nr:hypothetical protein [Amycolatopsis sp. NBRC 101858]GLY35780.1 hypothetical protein Amsp01_018040 [Amycolatopsis sp. NBRC 101858]